MSQARAMRIKLLLFDVDGVATDGTIWLFPAPAGVGQKPPTSGDEADHAVVSRNMVEAKGFHAHDGTAISLARLGGIKTGLITKRVSETVALRARDLRLDHVLQGISDKRQALEEVLAKEGLQAEQVAYVGDDIIDLPVMRACGLAFAVPNARDNVKREAHVILEHAGGQGAIRDAIEYLLRAQNKFDSVMAAYLNEIDPAKSS